MANTFFKAGTSNALTAQPASAGEKLILRSTQAADTGNATTTGLVSAVGATETNALTGQREKQTTASFESLTSVLLSAAQTGTVSVYGQGTKASGDIRVDTNTANNETLTIGLTGFTQVYTFKTTLTGAANEIHLGADKYITARNIGRAINAGTGAGTDYGTGTTANAYVAGYANSTFLTADLNGTSEATIYIRDVLAVSRQLTWSVSSTSANLTLRAPSGGVTGTLLARVTIGQTSLYNAFNLATEDLSDDTLPAKVTPTTDWVRVNGGPCCLRFRCANVSSAIALKYQTSTDAVNASDGITSITSLDDNPVATPRTVVPGEGSIEYIRLVFTANTNTTDTALDARVIY